MEDWMQVQKTKKKHIRVPFYHLTFLIFHLFCFTSVRIWCLCTNYERRMQTQTDEKLTPAYLLKLASHIEFVQAFFLKDWMLIPIQRNEHVPTLFWHFKRVLFSVSSRLLTFYFSLNSMSVHNGYERVDANTSENTTAYLFSISNLLDVRVKLISNL